MMRTSTALIACAALVTVVGCGKGNSSARDNDRQHQPPEQTASGTPGNAAQNGDASFEGCIQRGGGLFSQKYVLTMLDQPPGTTGTTGSVTKTGSSVEREQMQMAEQTYRLDPKGNVNLDDMVGKQVRLSGRITEKANLPNGKGEIGSSADTQRPNRDEAERLQRDTHVEMGDLALLEVHSATVTGQACGTIDRTSAGTTDAGSAPHAEGTAGTGSGMKTNGAGASGQTIGPSTDRTPRVNR